MRSQSADEPPIHITVNRPQQGPIATSAKALAAIAIEERSQGHSRATSRATSAGAANQVPPESQVEASEKEEGRGFPRLRQKRQKERSDEAAKTGQASSQLKRRLKFFCGVEAGLRKPATRLSPSMSPLQESNPTVAMVEDDWRAMASAPPLVTPVLARRPEEYVPDFGGTNPPWMRARRAELAVAACR